MKPRVLFLCATDGLHGPMAEALLGRIDSQHFEAVSAGTSCGRPHPFAVDVMNEIGIDLGQKLPRLVPEATYDEFDYVITLDETTSSQFPNFQRAETVHWKFDDPIAASSDPEKQLRGLRMVRDQIAQRLRLFAIVNARTQSATPETLSTTPSRQMKAS